MFNAILTIVCAILCFSIQILVEKVFKKEGLIVWIAVASVLANILVCKTVNILGFASSLGNIMFASNFLATDILNEKYGKKYAKKGVYLGLAAVVGFLVATQLALVFQPDSADYADTSMQTLFALSLRTSIASLIMYFLSNLLNVYLFDKLKKLIPGKLWFRSGITTIVSNCAENYLFAFGAFAGILDVPTILSIATIGTVIEIIVCFMDTPFLYLSGAGKHSQTEKV